MDTTTVALFHNFYFPLADLILKIIIGIVFALFLAKRGFRYKIKERLYDNYIQLTKLISEGITLRKHIMRRIIIKDISLIKQNDMNWQRKFGMFFQLEKNDQYSAKMNLIINQINDILNEISLYTSDDNIFLDFQNTRHYFFPRSTFSGLYEKIEECYKTSMFENLEWYVWSYDPDEVDYLHLKENIDNLFELTASSIDLVILEKDIRYHPDVFISKAKKAISSF